MYRWQIKQGRKYNGHRGASVREVLRIEDDERVYYYVHKGRSKGNERSCTVSVFCRWAASTVET